MRALVHVTALMALMGLVAKVSYNHQLQSSVYICCPDIPCYTRPLSVYSLICQNGGTLDVCILQSGYTEGFP